MVANCDWPFQKTSWIVKENTEGVVRVAWQVEEDVSQDSSSAVQVKDESRVAAAVVVRSRLKIYFEGRVEKTC